MWLERLVLGIVAAQNPAPTRVQAERNSEDALQESSSVCGAQTQLELEKKGGAQLPTVLGGGEEKPWDAGANPSCWMLSQVQCRAGFTRWGRGGVQVGLSSSHHKGKKKKWHEVFIKVPMLV